jgi:hypothetical protein
VKAMPPLPKTTEVLILRDTAELVGFETNLAKSVGGARKFLSACIFFSDGVGAQQQVEGRSTLTKRFNFQAHAYSDKSKENQLSFAQCFVGLTGRLIRSAVQSAHLTMTCHVAASLKTTKTLSTKNHE